MADRQALTSSLEKVLSEPVFQAAITKALAESLAATFCDILQDQADLVDLMSQAKPPEAFGPGLKVMGHAVVHGTGNSQWDKKRVELLDFCKVSGKYLVRTIYPQAAYGSRQITWIDRQSIDHSSSDVEQPKPAEATKQSTEPPDGWRWLEVGEVIRKGDRYFREHEWLGYDLWVGFKICESDKPSIRRNKFEVGEKVVVVSTGEVFTLLPSLKEGMFGVDDRAMPCHYRPEELAPYIEDDE